MVKSYRLLPFFFPLLLCTSAFAQCPQGQWPVTITVVPDGYPDEISWKLFANNAEVAQGTLNTTTVCVDTSACIRFEIYDGYGDGICCGYGFGSYTVSWNGTTVATGGQYAFLATHSFNCPPGTVCENPFEIPEGSYTAPAPNTFYSFTPDSSGIYSITTCDMTACDTKLWVYQQCTTIDYNGSNSGTLYYNDDNPLCAGRAHIDALLSAGAPYIIRVGLQNETACNGGIPFSVTYAHPLSSVIPIVRLTTLEAGINNDVKVPVRMQIIDNGPGAINYANQTQFAYEGNILAEWQGFTGPYYPKKNYDFDLIDEAGNKIDTSLFGLPAENDWLFKAEYLDNSLLVNTIAYAFARRMGRYAPRTRLCELVLDDQYLGVFTLTEKVKRDKNRVDIAKLSPEDVTGSELTGGYIIEMNINGAPGSWNSAYPPINFATCQLPVEFKYVYPESDEILPVQAEYIKTYVDSFENALNATSFMNPVTGYRRWIDVSTFLDFLIVNEFTMNYDSYGRSTYMYKEKDTDGGLLCIGPPWDYDRAMSSDPGSGWVWENTHPGWPFPFWWSKMYADSVYRHELACRWFSLREDVLKTSVFFDFIDSVTGPLYLGPAERNFAIWQTLGNSSYQDQIARIKAFLQNRLDWIDQTLSPFGAEIPSLSIPADTIVCPGSIYQPPLLADYSYNWKPGPEQPQIVLDSAGSYTLEISDAFGCYRELHMDVQLSVPDSTFLVNPMAGTNTYTFTGNAGPSSTYTWDFGDNTPGQTGMEVTHTYTSPGIYTVRLQVVDSIGCPAHSYQDIDATITGTSTPPSTMAFRVYPNPANTHITIDYGNFPSLKGCSLALLNPLGQTVLTTSVSQPVSSLDLSGLPGKGLYYILLSDQQNTIIATGKIVLQ